ncbi:MAG: NAD-dependent epimerase/dehydratase family protein [Planctomycetota bacterium]
MRYFVTGGTGLLGNNIVRRLAATGQSCLTLSRDPNRERPLDDVQTDIVHGDLAESEIIDSAVSACDVVIHSAGLIHLGWKRLDESLSVNREGTRVIAAACHRHNKRLVLVGTVNTLALGSRHSIASEDTPIDSTEAQVPCSYVISKRAGVEVVQSLIADGLSAVIVHPGFMLGPWDWKPSSGRMIVEVAKTWRPIAPSGGCSICDVRDVANATIQAAKIDVPSGRQYILAGENWTYGELWTAIAQRVGKRPPLMRAGPLQRLVAAGAGQCLSRFQSKEVDFNSAGVRMSSQFHFYDSSRAQTELDYQSRPVNESLDDLIAWLRHHGMLA